jgi:hypothetical protein
MGSPAAKQTVKIVQTTINANASTDGHAAPLIVAETNKNSGYFS